MLLHSFVTSKLDYCSSIYIGLPATRLNCLDRVLRSAARLIGRVSKFDHISAYMHDVLHWLPLKQRTEFRVAVLVWYSLIGQALPTLRTFVALPLAFGVPATSAQLSRVSFRSHLLAPPPPRAGLSSWLAFWSRMVSRWLSGHFQEYSPRNSFSNSKQHCSAALGSGALLSSPT